MGNVVKTLNFLRKSHTSVRLTQLPGSRGRRLPTAMLRRLLGKGSLFHYLVLYVNYAELDMVDSMILLYLPLNVTVERGGSFSSGQTEKQREQDTHGAWL